MSLRLPFISRLEVHEYFQLCTAGLILILEYVIRIVTALTPEPILMLTNDILRPEWVFGYRTRPHPLSRLRDAQSIIEYHGYRSESHVVRTSDGYMLGIQRILPVTRPYTTPNGHKGKTTGAGRDAELPSVTSGSPESGLPATPANSINIDHSEHVGTAPSGNHNTRDSTETGSAPAKKVVLLWHGFMMCSEVWVCNPRTERNLPFLLAEAGFDVWLGNCRGNKYAYKHVRMSPLEENFWKHGIDDFALSDIPSVIEHILAVTAQEELIYVGFSQGTAQMFAALSCTPWLNKAIKMFVALAPVAKPPPLRSSLVASLVRASPQVLYLLFGRKACLQMTLFWQKQLPAQFFTSAIDLSVKYLFDWRSRNIEETDKDVLYGHLYSPASVKSVVHWFQIMKTESFQMYDDDPGLLDNQPSTHVPHRYELANVGVPLVLAYGDNDTLLDLQYLLNGLKGVPALEKFCMEDYEHLDMLWGRDLAAKLFPQIIATMNKVYGDC